MAGMKAIGYTEFGGPEVLRGLELPDPHARPGQVRVRVQAAAVNPADTAARSGWMKRNYAPETLPGGSYPEPPYVTGGTFAVCLTRPPTVVRSSSASRSSGSRSARAGSGGHIHVLCPS
jgi:NADPH2:quinone reductase